MHTHTHIRSSYTLKSRKKKQQRKIVRTKVMNDERGKSLTQLMHWKFIYLLMVRHRIWSSFFEFNLFSCAVPCSLYTFAFCIRCSFSQSFFSYILHYIDFYETLNRRRKKTRILWCFLFSVLCKITFNILTISLYHSSSFSYIFCCFSVVFLLFIHQKSVNV